MWLIPRLPGYIGLLLWQRQNIALFVARPYGLFRQYWADSWKTDPTSSATKKLIVDTTAHFCFQLPFYSVILYVSGTSLREGITALIAGLTIGAVAGRPFGYFQDKWRKLWGTRPTLDPER
ncbi:L-alanine exporter AlaE [Candidatus Woesearchaeota archaeon]|nr:L-alanine exporter AlaE [Candidatus Woesearchaeota archaeon]